jgi:hypothetical protein
MVRNIETGRFERSLSALTAAGALVTAAEIFFEHDSASFGNKMMWIPVALGPVGAAAGVAGFFSRRLAKTALPVASAAIVANGLQGTYLHARGIAQKPGGWSNARYNMEMGPPLLAPLLVTMVGGMGLLAAVAVDKPDEIGPSWDQALAADRPPLLDVRCDPNVPPIPPHATLEQMEAAGKAILHGDENRWGFVKEGIKTKFQEFLPHSGQ